MGKADLAAICHKEICAFYRPIWECFKTTDFFIFPARLSLYVLLFQLRILPVHLHFYVLYFLYV